MKNELQRLLLGHLFEGDSISSLELLKRLDKKRITQLVNMGLIKKTGNKYVIC